jgi:hypothetical protein
MLHEADVRVVRLGLRRGDEDEHGRLAAGFMRAVDQLAADAAPLVLFINRQVGQIRREAVIGQGP